MTRSFLYRGVTTAPQLQRSRPRLAPPCPCCGHHGGFCTAHREKLAQIREELGGGGIYNQRSDRRKSGKLGPMCCHPDCHNPRKAPTPYCSECLEEAE